MCTVTFIPTSQGVYLTSNRDESKNRSIALPPKTYNRNGCEMIYPQDRDAAGSWIILKENGDAAVLLNGAFTKHTRLENYRKSRGLILLDILEQLCPYEHFLAINLGNIEPFTMVLFSKAQLWECRWDGVRKHTLLLDAGKPYSWCSATLYNEATAKKRKQLFLQWFSSTGTVCITKIMNFHRHAGKGKHDKLVINNGRMHTVSITAIFIKAGKSVMHYRDLLTGTATLTTFIPQLLPAKENFFQKIYWSLKKIKIRITNWEYWPMHLLYGPLYLYWCWLSMKAGSFFFFSAANPGIAYSGFVQECKSDIYKLIPAQYYPRTRLCEPGAPATGFMKQLKKEGFSFPLIAKPDMGEKGIQVKLLQSEEELSLYKSRSKVNFLVQEFIPYKQEVGIFYYRIPGEENGHLSGIVGKELLTVTGDGKSSIRSLLKKEDRSLLQLSALKYTYGSFLDTIVEEKAVRMLVPYGNHSRGAKFLNLGYKITSELTQAIDYVCKQIPGFYYGRLDIKFNSWEALSKGKDFSIIEVNGAGSAPTHIYDPSHSLWYAWKEICRHWHLLYTISTLNMQHKKLPLMSTSDGIKMLKAHYQYLKKIQQV